MGMRTKILLALMSISLHIARAQIAPVGHSFSEDEFAVYATQKDTISRISFEIGRHEPKDYAFATNTLGVWKPVKVENEEKKKLHHTFAPIYLRVTLDGRKSYYFLEDYYDVDMYGFATIPSEHLTIITARYSFYIYDARTHTLSSKQIPGLHQYEGEDAISGLFNVLSLFDDENYLLGNVQGFGVFCFDISNPANPIELMQRRIDQTDKSPLFLFSNQKNGNPSKIIVAEVDERSEHPNIANFYRRIRRINKLCSPLCAD